MGKKTSINIFDFDGTLTNETWPKYWLWVKKFGYHGECRNEELEEAIAKYRKKLREVISKPFSRFLMIYYVHSRK